jgi:hypothetical protein
MPLLAFDVVSVTDVARDHDRVIRLMRLYVSEFPECVPKSSKNSSAAAVPRCRRPSERRGGASVRFGVS